MGQIWTQPLHLSLMRLSNILCRLESRRPMFRCWIAKHSTPMRQSRGLSTTTLPLYSSVSVYSDRSNFYHPVATFAGKADQRFTALLMLVRWFHAAGCRQWQWASYSRSNSWKVSFLKLCMSSWKEFWCSWHTCKKRLYLCNTCNLVFQREARTCPNNASICPCRVLEVPN